MRPAAGTLLGPDVKALCAILDRVPELRERARQRAEREPLPGAPLPSNVAQLPRWPEAVRAVPNGFLRSALFGAIQKGRRRYLKAERLAALDGVEIRYTGERLDQGDLDTWQGVLHAVRLQELGSQCRVTSYALLKLIGKSDTGKNRATLQERITRLRANAVEVKQGRYTYIGGLILGAAKDEITQEWVIELDVRLRQIFAADQFTQIEWAVRHALDGKPLAQWLHGFFATHAKPFPLKVETLMCLSGSENTEPRSSRQKLRKALDALTDASATYGEGFGYNIRGDLVHVAKQAKGAQRRHLAKQASKSRKLAACTVPADARYRSSGCAIPFQRMRDTVPADAPSTG